MEAVEVRKALDGGVWITARAESISEALAAVKALHELPPSEAYREAREAYARSGEPLTPRAYVVKGGALFDMRTGDYIGEVQQPAPELTPEQEAYYEASNPPDPIDVLNVDKPARSYEDGRE